MKQLEDLIQEKYLVGLAVRSFPNKKDKKKFWTDLSPHFMLTDNVDTLIEYSMMIFKAAKVENLESVEEEIRGAIELDLISLHTARFDLTDSVFASELILGYSKKIIPNIYDQESFVLKLKKDGYKFRV